MTGSESLRATVALLSSAASSAGPGRQGALAIPTIWPWMAVPRTVPSSSTVILYAVAESRSFCSELMNMVRAEYGTWKHVCSVWKPQ